MTRLSLNPGQLKTVDVIEAMGFGAIRGLFIRKGFPCYESAPTITQSIKLELQSEQARPTEVGLSLGKEFRILFDHLSRLDNVTVDIEIRHRMPFRLTLIRRCEEFL